MDHREIRAIRGSLSRAAFAKLLGVTSLTVLRWELTADSKEARRPRAKMIENLRRLAAEGVGHDAKAPLHALHTLEEDEDDDASEPAEVRPSTRPTPAPQDAFAKDEAAVMPLLEALLGDGWKRAEDEVLALLSSTALTTHAGRTLATLGLVQVQLFGRLDVRAALTTLLPIIEDAERGALPVSVTARAHVMAAVLFGSPDSRFFDPGRVNVHAAKAEALLDPNADDLRVLLATGRISGARFLGPAVALRTYQANVTSLERATSPLARFLSEGLHGLAAIARGDDETGARHGMAGIAIAERLELHTVIIAVLADRAFRALRGANTPEFILWITGRARDKWTSAGIAPNEPMIRLMATECEALIRQARFAEARAVGEEAMVLGKRAGIARHALAVPLCHLYMFTNRKAELLALAEAFEEEAANTHRPLADVHAIYVRAFTAGLEGDQAKAIELAEKVCTAPETTVGIDYLILDAHLEITLANIMLRDIEGIKAAFRRVERVLEERPSVWHSATIRRGHGFLLMMQGRFAEARQKFESNLAMLTLIGDVVHVTFAKAALALVAQRTNAPDARERYEAARHEIESRGLATPDLLRRVQGLSIPPATDPWSEVSMTERLVVAVDRLSVHGLSSDLARRELGSILGELFPGRDVFVTNDGGGESFVDSDATESLEAGLRFGVRGGLDPEQRAALRMLATIAGLVLGRARSALEPDVALHTLQGRDDVLPHFIAAAPATRRLKAEIARLSRSSATILVTGESGSGKEVVARAVHDLSARAGQPYVVFNCASVPHNLFESQLFGYRKGAFTGAVNDSPGVIRAADGGTLFLDEIGELPLDTQPKLLRFLENGEVFPLGEQKARRVDVRVLAATHRDLGRLVREGRFREDLYYRLNVVPLEVPPLRERKDDIVALARVFVSRLAPDGTATPELGADAVAALKAHGWPGNVRELRNVIERAMAYAPIPAVLRAEHLRIAPAN